MQSRPVDGSPRRPAARRLRLISAPDHESLLAAFRRLAPTGQTSEPVLEAVLDDTIHHPGSFLRAQLAFDIGRRQGLDGDRATALAIGVEYFHTASLLFDDLPMMDDARQRRGRPCPHRVYGEAAAVLGALALVNQAYGLVWRVLADLPADRSRAATELVTACLGAGGVLGGQSRDLAMSPATASEREIRLVALEKTVPLIRLTLHLPALVGGAGPATLEVLDRLATSWGLAYQILDDCRDALLESVETGKTTSRDELLGRPNLLNHAGSARTLARLDGLMRRSRAGLDGLAAEEGPWRALEELQRLLEAECAQIDRRLAASRRLRIASPGRLEAVAS